MVQKDEKVIGGLTLKSINEKSASVSTGNKTELKVRFTGFIRNSKEVKADIEGLVIKGNPDDVRELMSNLNLDTVDEATTFGIDKNMQTRLEIPTEEDDEEEE